MSDPSSIQEIESVSPPRWVYGVTTVPERRKTLLPRTLKSLDLGGFESPWLFVDGQPDVRGYEDLGLPVSTRFPTIRTYGNWILGLWELLLREPTADMFAMFQDDFVCYRHLRRYLEKCKYPDKGYWNLYTFPSNQSICPVGYNGWYESNQLGRGAVALVFNKEAVLTLLSSRYMVERPLNAHRGWKAVDGGIVDAMKLVGYKEYVHNPSLVQHTGEVSSMGNRPHLLAKSFKGEEFSALDLLSKW